MPEEFIHKQLSEEIIGAAMAVLYDLRPGLDEKIYENALVLELLARGLELNQQMQYPVRYRSQKVGVLIPDLIVEKRVIVDPKVVASFNDYHVAQMLGYLNITGLKLALLVNFKFKKIQIKRITL